MEVKFKIKGINYKIKDNIFKRFDSFDLIRIHEFLIMLMGKTKEIAELNKIHKEVKK